MKASQLRDMNLDDLHKEERELRQALFNLRVQQATGQLEKPHRLREARRDLARVLTELNKRRPAPAKETR
ncbi:MAG: 50S ribosomal protein L29 [Acidobacteria bacterium]|nr:50S ribosomal protein L29 [Acidobacteriota bacterium]